jgi:arylsulfatase
VYYPDTAEVPESVAVNVRRRSFTIAAAVVVDDADAEGALFAQGAMAGGHSLFVQDHRLHYVYNWLGERIQKVSADRDITPGRHVLTAEFQKTGIDSESGSATGTLTLYVDQEHVGQATITTQPGAFGLAGTGVCVGRDSGSPVTPDYRPPFRFTGGTIERVVIDVSGDAYVDHDKEVLAWLARD